MTNSVRAVWAISVVDVIPELDGFENVVSRIPWFVAFYGPDEKIKFESGVANIPFKAEGFLPFEELNADILSDWVKARIDYDAILAGMRAHFFGVEKKVAEYIAPAAIMEEVTSEVVDAPEGEPNPMIGGPILDVVVVQNEVSQEVQLLPSVDPQGPTAPVGELVGPDQAPVSSGMGSGAIDPASGPVASEPVVNGPVPAPEAPVAVETPAPAVEPITVPEPQPEATQPVPVSDPSPEAVVETPPVVAVEPEPAPVTPQPDPVEPVVAAPAAPEVVNEAPEQAPTPEPEVVAPEVVATEPTPEPVNPPAPEPVVDAPVQEVLESGPVEPAPVVGEPNAGEGVAAGEVAPALVEVPAAEAPAAVVSEPAPVEVTPVQPAPSDIVEPAAEAVASQEQNVNPEPPKE